MTLSMATLSIMIMRIPTFSIMTLDAYSECQCASVFVLSASMLSIIKLCALMESVILLSSVMLSVIILSGALFWVLCLVEIE
jgi:hypothetical protein